MYMCYKGLGSTLAARLTNTSLGVPTSGDDTIEDYNMTRTQAGFIALGSFVLTWLGAVYGIHKTIIDLVKLDHHPEIQV
eukprot:m.223488 g.223488  ORF g.223488 m.223488 type:complete len:79 (+) comp17270_c0_seq1:146-382(+)